MSFEVSIKDRISFYINDNDLKKEEPSILPNVVADCPFRTDQNFKELLPHYYTDIIRYISYSNKPLWVQCGDSGVKYNYPILVKIRRIKYNTYPHFGVLANLNSERHWKPLTELSDVEWKDKSSSIIWRGATTGINRSDKHGDYTRLDLVKHYNHIYDIAFHTQCQNVRLDNLNYLKDSLSRQQLLHHKYIICIDGNDKASSLNWVLFSNSVPIMTKPNVHSWLCEPWLIPNVHYVEVKQDFSDLIEKVEWCKSHDKECKEIAMNGKAFISENFMRQEKEQEIEKLLVKKVQESIHP